MHWLLLVAALSARIHIGAHVVRSFSPARVDLRTLPKEAVRIERIGDRTRITVQADAAGGRTR